MSIDPSAPPWTFLSNHGHILVCIARDPNIRVREIAQAVGITERAVQRILGELEEAEVISRRRQGRRTRYEIDGEDENDTFYVEPSQSTTITIDGDELQVTLKTGGEATSYKEPDTSLVS